MSKLWNWIKSLFTSDNIGVIWRAMFTATKNVVAEMVSDPENQQMALNLARERMNSGKSSDEKYLPHDDLIAGACIYEAERKSFEGKGKTVKVNYR